MRTNFYSVVISVTKYLLAAIAVFLSFGIAWGTAQATVIVFDELDYVFDENHSDWECHFCEHPVTDQYLSQGLLIQSGYLAPYHIDMPSSPKYLLGSDAFKFTFVGELPTFVGMNIVGTVDLAVFFDIYGPSGFIGRVKSGGDSGSPDDLPSAPNEFISLYATEGISSIKMSNYHNTRIIAGIDNLIYEYASVPEPSSFALFALGMFGLSLKQNNRHEKIHEKKQAA